MGSFFSSENNLSSISSCGASKSKSPNQKPANPSALDSSITQVDSRSVRQSNSIYYRSDENAEDCERPLDEAKIEAVEDKRVLEMTVCKKVMMGHWFIALYLEDDLEHPLELHYVNIGSVLIYYSDKNFGELKTSRYSPHQGTTLKMVIKECFDFVGQGPYHLLSNSCQDFVTEIMSRFTNRQTYFKNIKIPVACSLSAPFSTKKVLTVLEKELLNECESQDVQAGITFLKDMIADLEDILSRQVAPDERSERKKLAFLRKVLRPLGSEANERDLPRFYEFMSKQQKEIVQELNENAMKAWRLAKFLIITELDRWTNERDLMSPEQALDEYRYNF